MTQATWAFPVRDWNDLAAAIVASAQAGAIGQAHLLRALLHGRIAYLPLMPDTSSRTFKMFAHSVSDRPAVALIGDDDGMDRGPAGWTQAARAVRWARAILLHAAGAEIAHYEGAVEAAEIVRRVTVIECGPATLPAWTALALAVPHHPSTLIICPRGGVHPIPVASEAMQ